MISHPTRDLALINTAGFLRSFGVGLLGVLLGIYLYRSGLSSTAIGFIIAMGLAGSACATILMSIAADRTGRKSFLVLLSMLSAMGGIAVALAPKLSVLATMAFIGMLNGTGTDRSAAFALDQAMVPRIGRAKFSSWRHSGTEKRTLGDEEYEQRSRHRRRELATKYDSCQFRPFRVFDRYSANCALVHGVPRLCRVSRLDQLQVIDFLHGG